MQIRRFEAKDIQEALKQVKSVLGHQAIILSTRPLRDPRKVRRSLLEVVAAVDHDPFPETRPPRRIADQRVRRQIRPGPLTCRSDGYFQFKTPTARLRRQQDFLKASPVNGNLLASSTNAGRVDLEKFIDHFVCLLGEGFICNHMEETLLPSGDPLNPPRSLFSYLTCCQRVSEGLDPAFKTQSGQMNIKKILWN